MSLPPEASSHHTIWLELPGGRTAAVRYASDNGRLVCLGDDGLAGIPAGSRVVAALRGLACGPLEQSFWVRVEDLAPDGVSVGLLSELLGDRSLGRSREEVERTLEEIRTTRRLVSLEA